MKKEVYDVVVIGSGMGGMCASSLLAHAGYKTLLVEKFNRLGGRFSSDEFIGYKLPTGAVGIEVGGVVQSVFKEVGAKFEVTPVPHLNYWIEGTFYEIPGKGGVRALLDILAKTEASRAKILGRMAKEIAAEKISGFFKQGVKEQAGEGMSFRDWLLQYTDNDRVLAVFQAVISAMQMINSWELEASEFFRFVSRDVGGGYRNYGIATRGNIALVENLANVVRANGDVWTYAQAKHIKVEDGVVKGVIIDKAGEEVEVDSQVVICNGGTGETVKLVGEPNLKPEYVKEVKGKLRPVGGLLIYLVSDRPLVDVPGIALIVGLRRVNFCLPITNICPQVAPPGKHLTYITGAPESCLKPFNCEEEIKLFVEDLKTFMPDYEKHADILRVDVRNYYHEWPFARTWPGKWDMPQETPIKNLFNVGDTVKPSGKTGLPSCAQSAKNVADMVKKQVKPR
ncbi:MAG: FAD-dependent oxidoreductase [Pseudomonadota bacterium]